MARNLSAGFIAAATSSSCKPIFFFEAVLTGLTLRLWSGIGDLSWDSKTWLGNGWIQEFPAVQESTDLGSTGMDVTLAGVPEALISTVLNNAQQNSVGRLWIGFLDSSDAVIADPYLAFEGKLDIPTIDNQTAGPTITFAYESTLVDLDSSKEYRYTPESQKIFAPNDKGFGYVASIAKGWKGQWGAVKQKPPKKTGQHRKPTRRRK